MSIFLFNDEKEADTKINIDELYEGKKRKDLKQLSVFNKILARIHKKIQFISKKKGADTYIWFNVPEYIFGEPLYDKGDCIGYLVAKLTENGFFIRYVHPNTLFISWHNFVPSYIRNEIKKKMGVVLNERGEVVENSQVEEIMDPNAKLLNDRNGVLQQKEQKEYTPIKNYKPTGSLIYNQDIFDKIEKKIGNS